MLDRFRTATDPWVANRVAWSNVMAADEEPNLSETVRLAELAVNGVPERSIPRMGLTETLTYRCTVPGRVYAG
jgi:hypothetical protein